MKRTPKPPSRPTTERPEPEIQQGHDRSIVKDEQIKRLVKQHPQRDEPKVDSIEPFDTPPP